MSETVLGPAPAWTPSDATFGARLVLVRHHMGLNAKEAALACGIPQQSWRNWEQNSGLPRRYVETCQQIARASGCDLGWLVDRRPTGSNQPTVAKVPTKLRTIRGEGRDPRPRTPMLYTVSTSN